jgi:hypothetical protein
MALSGFASRSKTAGALAERGRNAMWDTLSYRAAMVAESARTALLDGFSVLLWTHKVRHFFPQWVEVGKNDPIVKLPH